MNRSMNPKVQGAVELVRDAVEHGASAIERVHLETSSTPFTILESVPELAPVTRVVHAFHDAIVRVSYANVRNVTRLATGVVLAVGGARSADERGPERAPERPRT